MIISTFSPFLEICNELEMDLFSGTLEIYTISAVVSAVGSRWPKQIPLCPLITEYSTYSIV